MRKGNNQEELTWAENYRLIIYYNDVLEDFEWQFREVQAGRLPEDRLNVANWRAAWNFQPRMVQSFEGSKADRDPAFVVYWEENVINAR